MIKISRQPTTDPMMVAVRQLGVAIDRYDEAASRALGIGRSDLRALNLLEQGAMTAGDIGAALDLTSGSVTALLNRLAAADYVRRAAAPGDRRVVRVELEPSVYAAFARVYTPCGRAVAQVSGALTARARDIVVQAILDAAAAIEATRGTLSASGSDLH